jgi:hypothetical protein
MKKKYLFMAFLIIIIFLNTALAGALTGDVNTDGAIDIVDALLTAQYYVELDPQNFDPVAGDTDCNGSVDIIDALLIAQYYVGLITGFSGCSSEPTPSPVPQTNSVVNVAYPSDMFSYEFGWANGFDTWTIDSLPSWLTAPVRASGNYEDNVTFRIDWSQIAEGVRTNGVAIFAIQGEPNGKSEFILGVDLFRSDPQVTPTPEVPGTPMPTVPAMVIFEGYVYDATTYEPVPGAAITLSGESRTASATSSDDGYYQVGIPAGYQINVVLSITLANYTPQTYNFIGLIGSFNHDFPLGSSGITSLSPLLNTEKVNIRNCFVEQQVITELKVVKHYSMTLYPGFGIYII